MKIGIGQVFNPHRLFRTVNIPEPVYLCQELTPNSKLIYGRLYRFAGEDGVCYPAISTIGTELGLADRQVQRAILNLETLGFLRRCQRFDRTTNRQLSNGYQFLFHQVFAAAFEADQHKAKMAMGEGVINVTGEGDKKDTGRVTKKTPKERVLRESDRREYIQDSSEVGRKSAVADVHASQIKAQNIPNEPIEPQHVPSEPVPVPMPPPPPPSPEPLPPAAKPDASTSRLAAFLRFRTVAEKHSIRGSERQWDAAFEDHWSKQTMEDNLAATRGVLYLDKTENTQTKYLTNPVKYLSHKLWQKYDGLPVPHEKPKRHRMESADAIMKRDMEIYRKGLEAEQERLNGNAATA